jgi:hypothetical protein
MTHLPPPLETALAGRYVVERELGHGGMATVYLARDLKHDRLVARSSCSNLSSPPRSARTASCARSRSPPGSSTPTSCRCSTPGKQSRGKHRRPTTHGPRRSSTTSRASPSASAWSGSGSSHWTRPSGSRGRCWPRWATRMRKGSCTGTSSRRSGRHVAPSRSGTVAVRDRGSEWAATPDPGGRKVTRWRLPSTESNR